MTTKNRRFVLLDVLYLSLAILPLLFGIVLKILTTPESSGISISGALVYLEIPFPVQNLLITESQVNSWLVMLSITGLCLYLSHGASARGGLKRQVIAEWCVETCRKLVNENMGSPFTAFAPFIGAIMALSAFSSLICLCGLYSPTSDINVTAGWAILVFILITYYRSKCGPLGYIKSLSDPVAMAPLNIISEIATPISMAFRHYGNILSGSVISVLVAAALQGLSQLVLGWLPGFLGEFPFLRVGIPAVLSLYFDIFSGGLQAYIFAMLTMMYVSGAFDVEGYEKILEKRKAKKAAKQKKTA